MMMLSVFISGMFDFFWKIGMKIFMIFIKFISMSRFPTGLPAERIGFLRFLLRVHHSFLRIFQICMLAH